MSTPEPITRDSRVCAVIPPVVDKWVVDYANGLSVARDHIKVQRGRSSFSRRMWDGFTGEGGRRQTEINARLLDSVDGAFRWLNDLESGLTDSYWAIRRVNKRLEKLCHEVASLGSYAVETRERLDDFRNEVRSRFDEANAHLEEIDARDAADRQLNRVFNKWEAGEYLGLSLAGRCYAALEELRWGSFGDYCRRSDESRARTELLDDLRYRAIVRMTADRSEGDKNTRIPTGVWLGAPERPLADGLDALRYLAEEHDAAPFVSTVVREPGQSEWPQEVPLRCSAERIARALADEVFP